MNDEHTSEEHGWRQKLRLLVEEVLPEFQVCLADAIVEENEKLGDNKCRLSAATNRRCKGGTFKRSPGKIYTHGL